LESVLLSHPTKYIQVFKHWGKTSGAEAVAVADGALAVEVTRPAAELTGPGTVIVLWATTVDELRIVEMEEVVSKLVTPPVVWVKVTGQTVVEVWTYTVV
jgi:hypothetical protein